MGQETGNMPGNVGFKNLHVWQQAHTLVLLVYNSTKQFPREELFGLTDQLRRAVVSIPANIVEGYARASKKEFLRFLSIARGSLAEVEYYLILSKDLQYISEIDSANIERQRRIVGNLLFGLIRSKHS